MIKNFLKGLLATRRNSIVSKYYEFTHALSSLSPGLITDLPPGENILVFSPHCDDESIGCGGTLYKHHQKGHHLTAVFMTDGSKCDSNGNDANDIVQIRKQEAEAAAQILGIDRLIFLGHPDRQLRTTQEAVRQVEGILDEVKPDTVYLPFFLDNHPDHMATAAIVVNAVRQKPVEHVFFYEIWTAMIHNQLVDISDVIDKKLEAIRVYRSQKDIDNFAEMTQSLNRFRALGSNNQFRHAEALFQADSKEQENILTQFHGGKIH
ncbi:MAG: PIG-L family deacetylase [Nitrospina sp.]|nr:PIG-L family deacetylase [Nitrospina sp.]MBT3414101.1 PIG-L family deacetylase [Nitrospina sp.]MBT3856447.1 PIG-L family deacetylase [Nitrospina sp.]MBT4105644.1 PIG-L family deacetylase [Nitrospina sp.]MBT4389452.1 PIG-L family deacetylase [Nitrospina sp.]